MKKYQWIAISAALWLNAAMEAAAQADKGGHYVVIDLKDPLVPRIRARFPNGHTIQLATEALDPGSGHYGELNPEEARRGPDGDVYVQTLGCGIERVSKLGWKGGAQVHGIVFSGAPPVS